MTPDDFGALLERFTRSAFRLEARDHYDVPEEREGLAAFLSGQEPSRRTPSNDPWLALAASATATGVDTPGPLAGPAGAAPDRLHDSGRLFVTEAVGGRVRGQPGHDAPPVQ